MYKIINQKQICNTTTNVWYIYICCKTAFQKKALYFYVWIIRYNSEMSVNLNKGLKRNWSFQTINTGKRKNLVRSLIIPLQTDKYIENHISNWLFLTAFQKSENSTEITDISQTEKSPNRNSRSIWFDPD